MTLKPTNSDRYDVLVTGAGLAGIAAAYTAARAGARVALLERSKSPGGNVSLANVHTFCGLFLPPQKNGSFQYANPGFATYFPEALQKFGIALPPEIHGRVGVLPIFPDKLSTFCEQILTAVPKLDLITGCEMTALSLPANKDEPAAAIVARESITKTLFATHIIDATGDATAAALAGADTHTPHCSELQTATFIFKVKGADPESLEGYSRLKISAAITRSAAKGELPENCNSVLVRPAEYPGEAFISLNLIKPQNEYNPLDMHFMSAYYDNAIELSERLVEYLRANISGWNKCQVLSPPNKIGVRESRRIIGKHLLTGEDIISGKQYADAVATSSWPIEIWNHHTGADFTYTEASAGIPLGALLSRSHENLGAAGRCISGNHEALGALRVLGTAMATGQAIGMAAALAAENSINLSEVTHSQVNKGIDLLGDFGF